MLSSPALRMLSNRNMRKANRLESHRYTDCYSLNLVYHNHKITPIHGLVINCKNSMNDFIFQIGLFFCQGPITTLDAKSVNGNCIIFAGDNTGNVEILKFLR